MIGGAACSESAGTSAGFVRKAVLDVGELFCVPDPSWLPSPRLNRFHQLVRDKLPAMAFISAIDKGQSRSMLREG